MRSRSQALKTGPRSSAILAVAVLMAVALPVSIVLPREVDLPPTAPTRSEQLGVPAAAIQPATLPATAINLTSDTADWTGAASQSAYMVLVGSLLIGIGSIVKRTV